MHLRQICVVALVALPWLNPFSPPPSPVVVPWLLSAACGVLLFLVKPRANGRGLLAGLLLAASLNAIIGLLQYVGWTTAFGEWMALAQPGEAYGNLRQRNHFATLTNIGLVGVVWLAHPAKNRSPGMNLGLGVCAVLLVAANAASASRTGLLELGFLGLLAWVWGRWRQPGPRQLLQLSLVAYVASSLALLELGEPGDGSRGVWSRLGDVESGCNTRAVLWTNVLQLIAQRPWTGWGWGELDYAHFVNRYEGARFCEMVDNAHNLPLHLAVEFGIPVALLVCGFMLMVLWRSKPWQEPNAERQAAWAVLGIVFLHSLLEYPLWYGPFQLLCLLCLELLYRAEHDPAYSPSRLRGATRWGMGMVAFIAILYALWDYQRVRQIYLPVEARMARYRANPLQEIGGSSLFQTQIIFAGYITTPLVPENAARVHAQGLQLLHYSPEPSVVAKLVNSARLLGNTQEANWYEARFKAAYPEAYQKWHSDGSP